MLAQILKYESVPNVSEDLSVVVSTKIARSEDSGIKMVSKCDQIVGSGEKHLFSALSVCCRVHEIGI